MSITGTTASASATRLRSGTKSSLIGWDMVRLLAALRGTVAVPLPAILYTKIPGIQLSSAALSSPLIFLSHHAADHVEQCLASFHLDGVNGAFQRRGQLVWMVDPLAVSARCLNDLLEIWRRFQVGERH